MSPSPFPPPLVIGHRGSPTFALENTLESFDRAEAGGANGIELDVRLSFEGEAVVFHDADVETSAGRGSIANLTLIELLALEVTKGPFTGRIPLLQDVFLRYGGAFTYLIELKTGPSPRHGLMEHRVVSLLRQFALTSKAWVLSFAPDILRRIYDLEPALKTVLLFDCAAYRPEGSLWPELPPGCRALAPHFSLVTEELAGAAREEGLELSCWTVNSVDMAKTLVEWGVSTLITDVPGEMRKALLPPDPLLEWSSCSAPETGTQGSL